MSNTGGRRVNGLNGQRIHPERIHRERIERMERIKSDE